MRTQGTSRDQAPCAKANIDLDEEMSSFFRAAAWQLLVHRQVGVFVHPSQVLTMRARLTKEVHLQME